MAGLLGLDLEKLLRAAASGVVGGAVGWPADAAVNVANLARIGYGYGGHKLGLLNVEQMPSVINPADVPLTSSFISKNFGVGDSMGEQGVEMLSGLLSPSPKIKPRRELIAYHGSPHTFDKFDMSKIGTGEGAQAYGHGLYFAESPGVAKSYKDKLAKNEVLLDGQKVKHDRGLLDPQSMGLNALQLEPDPASAAAALRKAIADESLWQRGSQYDQRQNYAAAADWLEKNAARIKVDSGNLYKVDIPDEAVSKMLDWDKPLSQQPEAVRKALAPLQKMYRESDGVNGPYIAPDATGREVYGELRKMYGESKASAVFNGLGIPGIRYLDAGSRGKGGTSNFVLFDDKLPKILSRE